MIFDLLGIPCLFHNWGTWSIYENGRWRNARRGEWACRQCHRCNERDEGFAR